MDEAVKKIRMTVILVMACVFIARDPKCVFADGAGICTEYHQHMTLQDNTTFFLDLRELCQDGNLIMSMKCSDEKIGGGEPTGSYWTKDYEGTEYVNIIGQKAGTVTYTLTLAKKKKSKTKITKTFTVTYFHFEYPFTKAKLGSVNLKKAIRKNPDFVYISTKQCKKLAKKAKKARLSFSMKKDWDLISITDDGLNSKKYYKNNTMFKVKKSPFLYFPYDLVITVKNKKNGRTEKIRIN